MSGTTIYKKEYFFNHVLQFDEDDVISILIDKDNAYDIFNIPKRGGSRCISGLKHESQLRFLQYNLLNNFLVHIPLPSFVYGFKKGCSYKDYLIPHISPRSNHCFLRTDIKNFFESINTDLIRNTFENYFKLNDKQSNASLLNILGEVTTLNGTIPQGAISSPSISNIVFRQLDMRIYKYCEKLNVEYTRYADDMLFSFTEEQGHKKKNVLDNPFFIKMLSSILASKNLKLNHKKTLKSQEQISLNGFVVSDRISLSRNRKQDIIKCLYLFEKGGKPKSLADYLSRLNNDSFKYRIPVNGIYFHNKSSLINYLAGYRSFLIDWLPLPNDSGFEKAKRLIDRIEKLLHYIENV